ncbi:U-box domain-containing protein 12 [Camellia lanceoleosa]|uniref:U-box domain-containing protein 12 n=1 Tax=Camellia lanceoleosa TaxID=1840588 RepID=A0ACC0I638_9ERIC|nr:U-box domain-containing protein 12 [Camellia lanceoleosa]
MMALTIPTHFKFKPPNLHRQNSHTHLKVSSKASYFSNNRHGFDPKLSSIRRVFSSRVYSDGGASAGATPQQSTPSDIEALRGSSSSSADGYVALFVRMLGLDNDALDREQAIVALWKYSLGGKQYVDAIMQFRGSINLTVNLLKSDSSSTCEAAAGLLRMMSSVNVHRESVAESGAIEEITALLSRSSLTSDVKEQSICTLWNLSVDEKFHEKIVNSDLLPLLIKFLEDEDIKVKEAAGGVLANLALRHSNHKVMVEAGVVPKLAKLLKTDVEGSKIVRKEARSALLELAKDEYYRILVLEEDLLLVPLVGAAAYKSFKPALHSWPSLPDGTEIEQSSKGPSRYGASELLLGLNIQDKDANLEEAKRNAIVGRTQQEFLARIGAIEMEDEQKSQSESSSGCRFTLLPWVDGVARLVLILGLEDESAIARAAESIADASINEHMRVAFKEAGAVKHLVRLLDHHGDAVRLAVIHALERLSVSNDVCQIIEAEGALHYLIDSLKYSEVSESLMEKTLNIFARILDPSKEMKSKFYDEPVNGSKKKQDTTITTGSAGNMNETPVSKPTSSLRTAHARDLLDSAAFAHLVQILKLSSPNLQIKAASILEFVTMAEPCIDQIISVDIESSLGAVFQQKIVNADMEADIDCQQPELRALEIEEAGLAISAASRLLTRLLDFDKFRSTINPTPFITSLRKILTSSIPLHHKDWVAACLVKLSSLSGPNIDFESPISMEVTLYETIPRLMEQIENPSPEVQEAAVVELNRIISEGVVDSTRAVAAEGGIFPLVKLIEEGTGRAVEAGLAILYNLSMDAENHSAIVAAGAVPALRRIILSQRPQWTRALHLLRTLPT